MRDYAVAFTALLGRYQQGERAPPPWTTNFQITAIKLAAGLVRSHTLIALSLCPIQAGDAALARRRHRNILALLSKAGLPWQIEHYPYLRPLRAWALTT
jgi:hypothetical protein